MAAIKKIFLALLIVLFGIIGNLKADEGMWLLSLIGKNYEDMKKQGFKLTPEDIYNINKSSIKDAVIQFGRGCTGEVISEKGLILTNHHCGYGYIQSHSTIEHNYLRDGFWAKTNEEELVCDGLTAKFLIKMEDISDQILPEVNDHMSVEERSKIIREIASKIEKKAEDNNHYKAEVRKMFKGNAYYLFIYEIFRDVRLVGAPPSSIGKFGGDTDNWMWPRHTGDFSMFRIYMSPTGKPADFARENIPYTPKHHFPISLDGVKNGDFAAIMGYPGSTDRYLTSFGVKQAIDIKNPTVVNIREKKLAIMREEMNKSEEVKIKYSSKYARTANYWKYFIGQTKGLKRLNVIEKKQKIEKEYLKNFTGNKLYINALKDIEIATTALSDYEKINIYLREAGYYGIDAIGLALKFRKLQDILEKDDEAKGKDNEIVAKKMEALGEIKISNKLFYKDYDFITDKRLFREMIEMFYNDINQEYHPTEFAKIADKFKGDFDKYTDYVYDKSIFVSEEKMEKFMTKPSYKALDQDPIFSLMYSMVGNSRKLYSENKTNILKLRKAERIFLKGLMIMNKNKLMYPDANSTMRLTYGTVQDYDPMDAVEYDYYTTIDGIMQKEDDTNEEFIVPQKLKELYKHKNYGNYADKSGDLHVCFLTTNDITGGNSGSGVFNAKGELIGCAFDGNWEAMSGDIAFEPELQRTIVADIRYILFIVDKFAGAENLINEMTILEKRSIPERSKSEEQELVKTLTKEFLQKDNSKEDALTNNIIDLIRKTIEFEHLDAKQKLEIFNQTLIENIKDNQEIIRIQKVYNEQSIILHS